MDIPKRLAVGWRVAMIKNDSIFRTKMKVAFGMKLIPAGRRLVVVGELDDGLVVADRRRIELVEDEWAKQPYHAAEDLKPDAARDVLSAASKPRAGSQSERCEPP